VSPGRCAAPVAWFWQLRFCCVAFVSIDRGHGPVAVPEAGVARGPGRARGTPGRGHAAARTPGHGPGHDLARARIARAPEANPGLVPRVRTTNVRASPALAPNPKTEVRKMNVCDRFSLVL